MEDFISMFVSTLGLVVTTTIEYRLPCRMLVRRLTRVQTFLIIYLVNFCAGWLNVNLQLVSDIAGNTFYYGMVIFGLYRLLFKGNTVKTLFIAVLVSYGFPIAFYIFLPIAQYLFLHDDQKYLAALAFLEYGCTALCAVEMEYIGKKFQNLKKDLPTDYTVYLTVVIIFVHTAIYSSYDQMIFSNQAVLSLWDVVVAVVFAITGTAIVFIATFAVDRQVYISLGQQLQALQVENFKNREREWRKLSGFRHDIKNHLLCLNTLLESGKKQQALAYMSNLTDTVNQFNNLVQTGNDYADALLGVKYAEALEAKISVSIEMTLPSQGFVDPVDLCCILSNAFDNAIAACEHLEGGDKWITARGFVKQGQLVIVIKNSKPPYVTVIDNEVFPKEITFDHGLGLDTVKAVVEKYKGTFHLSGEEDFSFGVLLPQLRS